MYKLRRGKCWYAKDLLKCCYGNDNIFNEKYAEINKRPDVRDMISRLPNLLNNKPKLRVLGFKYNINYKNFSQEVTFPALQEVTLLAYEYECISGFSLLAKNLTLIDL